jgi:uncharacterized delta-60 repeat protein
MNAKQIQGRWITVWLVGALAACSSPELSPQDPDTQAPSVGIEASMAMMGKVALLASATDNVGVRKVEFYEGSRKLGEDTTSPYEWALTYTASANGAYSYTAKAYDAKGNVGFSAPVDLQINVPLPSGGPLDQGFAVSGGVTTPIGKSGDTAYAIALQPDGKIVAGGVSTNSRNTDDFALVRYNPDGSLDASFAGGKVVTDFSGNDSIYDLALQNDGKIVAVGYGNFDPNASRSADFALARYNPDGTLDTSFAGGKVALDFAGAQDYGRSVAIQADGKIVVAGHSNGKFAVARYNTNGTLDSSFGSSGKLTTNLSNTLEAAYAVAIQSDGKIVVSGYAGSLVAVVRYNTNGTLDTSFDSDGKVLTNVGNWAYAYDMAIQSDGKIVLAGTGYSNQNQNKAVLVRYNTNGSLDTSFGTGGTVGTPIGGGTHYTYALALQQDNKPVLVGYTNTDFTIMRYNTNGTLDTSFDRDGIANTDFGDTNDYAYAVAIQSNGDVLIAGSSSFDFALARYKP